MAHKKATGNKELQANNNASKDNASPQSEINQEELTLEKTGEAAEKFYKVLLFYWSLIHENKRIHLVPIALTVLEEVEAKSEKIHKVQKSPNNSAPEEEFRQDQPTLDLQTLAVSSQSLVVT